MMQYTHNYMKIFLDTAETDVIRKYFQTGLVDGVTTNPTLIMKSLEKFALSRFLAHAKV